MSPKVIVVQQMQISQKHACVPPCDVIGCSRRRFHPEELLSALNLDHCSLPDDNAGTCCVLSGTQLLTGLLLDRPL